MKEANSFKLSVAQTSIKKIEQQIRILKLNLDIKEKQLAVFKADLKSLQETGELSGMELPKLPLPNKQVKFWEDVDNSQK